MALPPILPRSRTEALRWYGQVLRAAADQDEDVSRETMRWLARNDLFFLLVHICGRRDLNHDWLFARCREVQAEPDGHVDLWAREHYKSTIITFGLTIQDILNDPEITIGIFSFNRPLAKQFLRQIKYEFESNETLKGLFPDILWDRPKVDAPKWSEDDGIVVKRQGNPKESTIEAWGLVDGQPTSKHFKLRVYDDIVTDSSVTTPEMIRKVTAAWELSDNLGTADGIARYAGTRYALADTYSVMKKRGFAMREYPATSDGTDDCSKAVFMDAAVLARKRRVQGPYTFGCQMLLNPTADASMGFRAEWMRYWPGGNFSNLTRYIVVDPASQRKKDSDYTAMWVIGIGADGNWYQLDMVRDRLNLVDRCRALMRLHRKWKPRRVGYEQYGLQADIEHIEFVQAQENYRFPITKLGGQMPKDDRIKRLTPIFEQGRFHLIQGGILIKNWEGVMVDVNRQFIEEEYTAYPVSEYKDMLDSLSRLLDDEMGAVHEEALPGDMAGWRAELEASSSIDWQTA